MSMLLQVANVSFSYGTTAVLHNIDLTLAPGDIVALIGPNGSGKSTLIKSLTGFLHAAGEIQWFDRPLRRWRRRELATRLAYLSQSPLYEPGQTVLDVLRLGRAPYWHLFGVESARDGEIVDQVVQRLSLADLLHRPIDQISGGQRQMVFVGRALVQEPRAILLDEPNTFLDLRHQVELMSLLRALAKEQHVGILLASHDLNLAASTVDRLVLLESGTIAAEGRPQDVLDPALLARVYGVAMERIDRAGHSPLVVPQVM